MSEQWIPGTFEIAMGAPGETRADDVFTGYENVSGETWGAFGIHADRGPWGTAWAVTHVPTGRQMVTAESKAAARRFCRDVAPLLGDWSSVQPGQCPPEIRDAVIEACHRARGAMFVPVERGGQS